MKTNARTQSNRNETEDPVHTRSGNVLFSIAKKQYVASIDGGSLVVTTVEEAFITTLRNGYGTSLTVVTASADGSLLAAGSCTGEVLAWETQGFALRLANRAVATLLASILDVECSPCGTFLAALTASREVQVWDIGRRRCLTSACVADDTTSLAWTSDELRVIACPSGETLIVLEPAPQQQQIRTENTYYSMTQCCRIQRQH